MTTEQPHVAVCIPAYDETSSLAALLRSIAAVDYPRELIQVVVAVDGANPKVVRTARSCGATVVELTPNQGSYAARNAAIEAITPRAECVLFTDADCIVSSGWVSRHVASLVGADLVGGGVRWQFSTTPPTPAEWVDSIRHLHQRLYVERDGYAATCNLSVHRRVLADMRFDPTLRTGGDAEFGRRAVAAGFSLTYDDEAWVLHTARRTRRALMRKVRRIAGGVEQQRDRWVERGAPPRAHLNRGVYLRAQQAGLSVGPWWGVRACLLNYEATVRINRAVQRTLARARSEAEASS